MKKNEHSIVSLSVFLSVRTSTMQDLFQFSNFLAGDFSF